jgi:hypothetical protein
VDHLLSIDIEPDYNCATSKETVLECTRKHKEKLKMKGETQPIHLVFILATAKRYFGTFLALDSGSLEVSILIKASNNLSNG